MIDYSTYYKTQYHNDLEYCKHFIFSFGSNYTLGVKLFPRAIREATIMFYSFVRYADELVDNPDVQMIGQTHDHINEFIKEWEQTFDSGPDEKTHPAIRATYWVFRKYNIPFSYAGDFLSVMRQDITQERYDTYSELVDYMWGSAAVIGCVMTHIVGYTDQDCFHDARALGEAMQLANILRDMNEDYTERNRIYLPKKDMELFGVGENMIAGQKMTSSLERFIRYYLERTEQLFDKGISGIYHLKNGKFSIFLASRMYRYNIRILKRRNYNIFGPKIRLSKWQKIKILISTIFLYPFWLLKNKS